MSKLRKGTVPLSVFSPALCKEWDFEKNAPLTPEVIAHGSNIKVWWKCSNGHSWEASVNNRTSNGRGCPYCSGRLAILGETDFATLYPELVKEWNYEKNGSLLPSCFTGGSGKKVWWKCTNGHEWETTIASRTTGRQSGCPYCSKPPKKILVGFNDFETWCNENNKSNLLKEWNYERNTEFSPKEITYGCGKRVWWKCSRGHEWCVTPASRTFQGSGCPVCSRTQTSFPEQAIAYYVSKSFNIIQRYRKESFEIDVYLNDYNIGIEYDGMFYHTESERLREIEKESFYKEHNILLLRVKESKTKTGLEGNTLFFVPKRKMYINDNFNSMLVSLLTILEEKTGSQTDKNVDVLRDELEIREHYASIVKEGSVANVYPELVSEWDVEKNNGMLPEHFSANAHTKVWWKCSKGHSWQASIASRGRKLGCPYCAGQRTIEGKNDFETWCNKNNPILLKEWNYFRNEMLPSEIQKTSNQKVWWFCSRGHEWQAVIANRVHGTGCPVCNKCDTDKRGSVSLAQWCRTNGRMNLLKEWDYERNSSVNPDNVTKGSHKKVWWKCSKGHEWEAQIKSRTYNHGCPYCSGTYKKALAGKNDLETWCKENNKQYILDEWDFEANEGLTPNMFTFGSHKRINWKCRHGHKWTAIIKERTKFKGNMCPECNKSKE